jgi:hypothetical protein
VNFHKINVLGDKNRAFRTLSKLEKPDIVVIFVRLRSEVRYEKSEKATLAAVAIAVFAVTKEQRATAAVHRALPDLLAELVGCL